MRVLNDSKSQRTFAQLCLSTFLFSPLFSEKREINNNQESGSWLSCRLFIDKNYQSGESTSRSRANNGIYIRLQKKIILDQGIFGLKGPFFIIQSAAKFFYRALFRSAPTNNFIALSTPMGVDYVVIGFDVEVQPLATHNAA